MVATTVTTTTTTAVTADPTAVAFIWTALVVVAMVILMVSKELAAASESPRARNFARLTNVGLVPLAFALFGIAAARFISSF
ncbi:hypothetical protein Mrose_02010 [Calidithermus roseus]|uniref:Uncharacterized protein n=1 Tax=Calidithermus roseus TaxID=1644118 RepID=A0A399EUI9_9DEIN|nr:hypothetical protein Mrose_02010 [Calidithermus roseus]